MNKTLILLVLAACGCETVTSTPIPGSKTTSEKAIATTATQGTSTTLLTQMADTLTTNPQQVFFAAAMLGDRVSVQALKRRGADINVMDPTQGQTALHQAVLEHNTAAVRLLVDEGADVNKPNLVTYTPLYDAINLNDYATARLLLEHHANPDVAEPPIGSYPLHAAATDGDTTATQLLLAFKANPNVRNDFGTTPLHLAANAHSPGTLRALLEAGADANAKTNKGTTALDVLKRENNPEAMALIRRYLK